MTKTYNLLANKYNKNDMTKLTVNKWFRIDSPKVDSPKVQVQ